MTDEPLPSVFNVFLAQERQRAADAALTASRETRGIDPVAMGAAFEEGARRGVPPLTLVDLDGNEFGEVDDPTRLTEQLLRQPSLARYLGVPEHAAVSRGDEGQLVSMVDWLQDAQPVDDGSGGTLAGRALRNAGISFRVVPPALQAFWTSAEVIAQNNRLALFDQIDQMDFAGMTDAQRMQALWPLGPMGAQTDEVVRYALGSESERAALRSATLQAFTADAENLVRLEQLLAAYNAQRPPGEEFSVANFGRWAAYTGISAAPQLLAALAVGLTTGGTGLALYGTAMSAGEIMSTAVEEGVDLSSDTGFLQRTAAAALAAGAVDVFLGPVSLRTMAAIRRELPEQALDRAARGWLRATGREVTREALEEGVVEVIQSLLQEFAVDGSLSASPEAWLGRLEAFAAGVVGGVTASPIAVAVARREVQAAGGLASERDIRRLNEIVAASETRTRSPSAFGRFLAQAGFTRRGVFVDASELLAVADREPAVLDTLGLQRDRVEAAAAAGQQVAVNMATYMQAVPGKSATLEALFAQHGTLSPGLPSASEALAYGAVEAAERARERAAERAQNAELQTLRARVAKRVREAVSSNIGASPAVSGAAGELHAAILGTLAERMGDESVADSYALEVLGPATPSERRAAVLGAGAGPQADTTFTQDTPPEGGQTSEQGQPTAAGGRRTAPGDAGGELGARGADQTAGPTDPGTGGAARGGPAPLDGAPRVVGASGPDARLVAVAERYAAQHGIVLRRQSEFVEVDPERATRIAQAYEEMQHAPNDPDVKEAYANLIAQTIAQYNALVEAGYEFTFFDSETDPYEGNPWNAMRDLRANQRMAVYGTYDGYGTDGITDSERADNPMLEDTGLRWPDQRGVMRPVTANDLFRAVHDAFGHGLEGAGFRARGEENAWQAHVRLFTGSAVAAITTETRGQNSWLNYGPYGERNRTAAVDDTVFAEQKTGLMPEWTWTEGRAGDATEVEGDDQQTLYQRGIPREAADVRGGGGGQGPAAATRSQDTGAQIGSTADGAVTADDLARIDDPAVLEDFLTRPGWGVLTATTAPSEFITSKADGPLKDGLLLMHARQNDEANARLRAYLTDQGIAFIEMQGVYKGEPDGVSFMLIADEETVVRLGRQYRQESVLTRDGLIFTTGPTRADVRATGEVVTGTAAQSQEFHSLTEGGTAFSMGLDFERSGPGVAVIPPGYSERADRPQLPVRPDGLVELHHWSRSALDTVDPAFAGTGPYNSAERRRGARVSFFGINPRPRQRDPGTGYVKEAGLGPVEHVAVVDPARLYPYFTDPDGLLREGMNLDDAEAAIRAAGYIGYYTEDDGSGRAPLGNVAVLFEAVPVEALPGQRPMAVGDRVLFQERRQPGTRGVLTGEPLPSRLSEAKKVARERRFQSGRELKLVLQQLAAEGLDTFDEAAEIRLAEMAVEDALEAVQDNLNAIGWYDRKVTAAKEILRALYPGMLDPGSEGEFVFTWALAVTSNGVKVVPNFQLAARAFDQWVTDGTFPKKLGTGTAAENIDEGLQMFFTLRRQFDSWEDMRDFMIERHEVREIEARTGIGVTGEGKSEIVAGAAVLGPKIGNGFFSNLYGYFDMLTMDRWLMRTVGRWRGTLVKVSEERVAANRAELRQLLGALNGNERPALLGHLYDGLSAPQKKRYDAIAERVGTPEMTDADLDLLAELVRRASSKVPWRDAVNEMPGGDLLRRLGNRLDTSLDGQQEAPQSTSDRSFLRRVFRRALDYLNTLPGMEALTMADLQALLWYPEKLLYESAKKKAGEEVQSYDDDEAPDYENAALALYRERTGRDYRDELRGAERQPDVAGPAEVAGGEGGDRTLFQWGGRRVGPPDTPASRILNQPADDGPRGLIRLPGAGVANGTTVIEQFTSGDESTFLHESGHFFLEVFRDLAQREDAPQQMKDDLETVFAWMGKTDEGPFTAAEQEMWAEAFENYLYDGVAPSPSLKVVFRQFARWLTRVYSGLVRRPDTQPSAAVRAVMDRLLATDEELAAVQSELDAEALYRDVPPYFSEDEWRPYVKAAERSDAEAHGRLLKKQMERLARKKKADMAARREELTATIRRELSLSPVYTLITELGDRSNGVGVSGRLDQKKMVELFGPEVLQDLTSTRHRTSRHLYGPNATDPEEIAQRYYYESVGKMLVDLRSARPLEEELQARVEAQLDEEFGGDPLSEDAIREEAEAAIKAAAAQDTVAHEVELLRAEQAAAARAAGRTPAPDRGPTPWQRENAAARAEAQRRVDKMTVREVLGYRALLRASQKAAREAQRALAAVVRNAEGVPQLGSIEALKRAEEAKRRQLLNDHMYRMARDKADLIKRSRKRFMKLTTKASRSKLGAQFGDAIVALLDQFEFREVPVKQAQAQFGKLMQLQQDLVAQGRGAELTGAVSQVMGLGPMHYTNMTMGQMQALIDAVNNITSIARQTNRQIAEEAKRDFDLLMQDIVAAGRENLRGKPVARTANDRSTFATGIRQFLLTTLNADTIIRQIDGASETLGVMYRAVKLPIDRAISRVQTRQLEAAKAINALYAEHLGDYKTIRRLRFDRKLYPGLGTSPLSKIDLLTLALNSGNATNFLRLTDPDTEGAFDAAAVRRVLLQELTESDWKFVQGMWDYLGSYWPEIEAQERALTGVSPERVQPELMIEGAPSFVKGGYFPIRYDADLNAVAAGQERLQMAMEGVAGPHAKAQTRAGHTEARVQSVNRLLKLDINIANSHVFQVIHDLELRVPIRDAGRVIYDQRFAKLMAEHSKTEDVKALVAWLEDAAIGSRIEAYGPAKWFRWMRGGFTLAAIGFRMSTILIQPLGLTQSLVQVGYRDMVKGYSRYAGQIPRVHQFAMSKSAIMPERVRTFDKDVNESLVDIRLANPLTGRYVRAVEAWTPWAYWGMQQMQYWVVDLPTWYASFEKHLRAGYTEDDAVAAADRDVRVAQGSGLLSDRGLFERGRLSAGGTPTEFARLFTVLGSYMFGKFNLAYQRAYGTNFKQPVEVVRLLMDWAMLFVVEAVLVYLLRNGWPDEEDDEPPIPAIIAREGFHTVMGSMPLMRDISAGLRDFGTGAAYGEYIDTAAGLIEGIAEVTQAPFSEDVGVDRDTITNLIGFGGTFLAVPSGKLNSLIEAVWAPDLTVNEDAARQFFTTLLGLPTR